MAFRKLVTALRLLKPGGAALSSVGWWRTDDGPWQEVPLGTSGRSRGGALSSRAVRARRAGRAVRACAQPPGAGRRTAMGADALRARLRAARCARRAVRLPARDAGAAGPRRPIARRACSSPRGALRGAGASPRRRELRRAGVPARAAGHARQRRRRPTSSRSASGRPTSWCASWRRTCGRCCATSSAGILAPDLVGIAEELLASGPRSALEQDAPAPDASAGSGLRGAPPGGCPPRRSRGAHAACSRPRTSPTPRRRSRSAVCARSSQADRGARLAASTTTTPPTTQPRSVDVRRRDFSRISRRSAAGPEQVCS